MSRLYTKIPHVIVNLECAIKTQREIVQGILKYIQQNNPWTVTLITGQSQSDPRLTPSLLKSADGYIGHGNNARTRTLLESFPLALIYSADIPPKPNRHSPAKLIGSIGCDNRQVGTMAAEFFLKRGFTSFAYIGSSAPLPWSDERNTSFSRRLRAAGHDCRVFDSTHPAAAQPRCLQNWLTNLPAPTAVFVANDVRGQQVLNICATTGISVPGHLFVLACDNEIVCETSLPTLSSIRLSTEKTGFAVAEQMDRFFIEGSNAIKPTRFLYDLANIVERTSTNTHLLSKDPLVERARSCIQLNVYKHIRVKDLAQTLSVSRRLLEMRFRDSLGRSVHDEIASMQLEVAKNLLARAEMPIEAIAEKCGYSSASHFCTAFKRHIGMAPGAWKKAQTPTRAS